ncbi:hypothetical protein SAMN04488539_2381 [Corynebacterium timonense]|uniref:Uncharacterized protein n=1 Tax=Corynebacterium timonense TaxID=441500 RepID=A0A1H1V0L3_9CORY|nr:hypothetical protein SAMN04488539_2381 [Corynebacterium timonense]
MWYWLSMDGCIGDIVAKMGRASAGIRFTELERVCDHYFEKVASVSVVYL